MLLDKILSGINYRRIGSGQKENPDVRGLTTNSQKVRPGDIFIALSGLHYDGHQFVAAAYSLGAVAAVVERPVEAGGIVQIVVDDTYQALAAIANNFYGHPSRSFLLYGITGTNGKTSISYLLEAIFRRAGRPCGVIGTIGAHLGKKFYPLGNTTPFPDILQKVLWQMKRQQAAVVAMEVSSHSLVQHRVDGCEFDVAIFTNLTRDHLDFHGSFENYFQAKSLLFRRLADFGNKKYPRFAIINTDDEWGQKMVKLSPVSVLTYGRSKRCDFYFRDIKFSPHLTRFYLECPWGNFIVRSPLIGQYNVYNVVAAMAASFCQGVSREKILAAVEDFSNIPGRLERVEAGQPFTIFVDYAHTDDALANVLKTLRQIAPDRIITVFGCGGERDRTKRPLMGEVASEYSDWVIVTSDNPRGEDPERITLDIELGIRRKGRTNYQVIIDRQQAIAMALTMARRGDIVLLAGKGHENYQIVGDKKILFNDQQIARKILRSLRHN